MLRKKTKYSISSTINTIYLAIIIICLLLFGGILFSVANQQVDQNTEETMNSLINQKSDILSSVYQETFEDFYAITQSNSARNLLESSSPSSESYLTLSEEVDDFYYRNASLIDSIYIDINDYYEISVSEQQNLESSPQTDYLFHPEVPEREGYFWLNNHRDILFSLNQDVQTIVYYMKNESNKATSVFVVNLKTSFIDSVLTELTMDNSYMLILSPESYHFAKAADVNADLNQKIYSLFQEDNLSHAINDNQFNQYNVRSQTIGTNKWELVLVTPKTSLLSWDSDLQLWLIVLFLFFAILIFMTFQLIKKYISNPIEQLARNMETTESYDEKITPTKDVPQELSILYETYNTLTDRNTRLIEQMETEQEEKLELELALLHSQISPHFLYNTLYSIKGLVDMGMNEEASEMVLNLSDFLRTSLSRGKEVIPIEEELKNIESYLYMMNMRYGDYFDYEIRVSEKLFDYHIVKLTLQPLVENAIYHGVMHSREKGLITIGGEKFDDHISMYVIDNGKGISVEKLAKIKEEFAVPYLSESRAETGVGLRSVDIRVKNRYGNNFGMEIESEENEYTKVTVTFPLIKGEDESV